MKKIATPIAMTVARATPTPMPALAPEVSFRRVRCFDVRFVRCMREGIVDVVDGGKLCRKDQKLVGRVEQVESGENGENGRPDEVVLGRLSVGKRSKIGCGEGRNVQKLKRNKP